MTEVTDLDILRPTKAIVKIGGKEIDVSFVPCGITFDLDKITEELRGIPEKKIKEGGAECKKAFTLAIKMCSLFCAHSYPDMDENWFLHNVDAMQVNAFANVIKDALMSSYKGVAEYGKK